MRELVCRLAILLVGLTTAVSAQRLLNFYAPDDWVSYTNTRFITGIARGFNTVYFATNGGILRYDRITERWLPPLTTSSGMPDNRVRRLAVDRLTDEIWIETPIGLSYFSPTFEDWSSTTDFPNDKEARTAFRASSMPQYFTPFGYSFFAPDRLLDRYHLEYRITQYLQDDAGIAWLGIWGLGPGKIDDPAGQMVLLPQGPYDDDIADLEVVDNEIWFLGGGLGFPGMISVYDRETQDWNYFDSRREREILSDQYYTITHDKSRVWIGAEIGLIEYDRKERRFSSYSGFSGISGERVTALLPIKNNLLIGTERGVSIFDLARDSIYEANTALTRNLQIYDFALRDTTIFAASDIGVLVLQWGGSAWRRLLLDSPTLRSAVYDIDVVDSLLYAVGQDGVVVVNLNDLSFTLHDRVTVFRGAELTCLLVHEGFIWAGGGDGAFRFNPRKSNWYRYTTRDGLIAQRVRSLAADGNHIWIGTEGGATRFFWKNFDRSDWLQ